MSFSLKTLFIAVTVAAILLAIFFALPAEISTFVCTLISVVAPAGFVSWIVYGRGYGRAFAIGCAAASAILLFSTSLGILLTAGLQKMTISVGPPVLPTNYYIDDVDAKAPSVPDNVSVSMSDDDNERSLASMFPVLFSP